MTGDERFGGQPEESAAALDPARVEQYVRETGWELEPRLGKGRLAVYQRPGEPLRQLRIPRDRGFSDYPLLMTRVIESVAGVEGRAVTDVLQELLLVPADFLRFTEAGPSTRAGIIPLDHARDILYGVRRVLLVAAHSVLRPQPFHRRLNLAEAEQFLQRCQLGQTERGSFTFTVACPLNAGGGPDLLDPDRPFTRRVTGFLMHSLDRLARSGTAAVRDELFREADSETDLPAPRLSANLCEAVLDLAPQDDDGILRVNATWDPRAARGDRDRLPGAVAFTREALSQVEYLAGRLRPIDLPESQLFVGTVETLDGRVNARNRREGDVVVRVADEAGEHRRARVELGPDDYAAASEAHLKNRLISVRGILRRGGQRLRIAEATEFQMVQPGPLPRKGR